MAKEVVWTKIILETFLEESGILDRIELGDEKARILEGIMRTRCAGWKISKQAMEFNCDESTINKYITELKKLYDETQKHSLILPKRIKQKQDIINIVLKYKELKCYRKVDRYFGFANGTTGNIIRGKLYFDYQNLIKDMLNT